MARGFSYAPGASVEVVEAESQGLDRDRLRQLGASTNKVVREAVARREDCPLGLMVTLAHDNVSDVRAAVAANPSTSHTILAMLAEDRSHDVLVALVRNPSLADDVVDRLATHRKSGVRNAASARQEQRALVRVEDLHTPELRDSIVGTPPAEADNALHAAPEEQEPEARDSQAPPVAPLPYVEDGYGFLGTLDEAEAVGHDVGSAPITVRSDLAKPSTPAAKASMPLQTTEV